MSGSGVQESYIWKVKNSFWKMRSGVGDDIRVTNAGGNHGNTVTIGTNENAYH